MLRYRSREELKKLHAVDRRVERLSRHWSWEESVAAVERHQARRIRRDAEERRRQHSFELTVQSALSFREWFHLFVPTNGTWPLGRSPPPARIPAPLCAAAMSKQMVPMGRLNVGTEVECPREAGDEFERCHIKSIDVASGSLELDYGDGFMRKGVPFSDIKFIEGTLEQTSVQVNDLSGDAAAAKPPAAGSEDEAAYAAEVGPQLPAPPTEAALAADEEAKYAFIKAYKDVGNSLFKAGKLAWAIRTYTAGVDALERHCYLNRERMLWDYFARGPCGQCYSNAALCALKQGEPAAAATLCEQAMTCKPEDTDLVKVLLRKGQALLALGQPDGAKEALERAADKEPSNRAVREELIKAKKAVIAIAKEADTRLFASVDLKSDGLTSKRDSALEQVQTALDKGFEALVEHKDTLALKLFAPLVESKAAETKHRRPATMLAAYGIGVVRYQARQLDEAITALSLFFKIKLDLKSDGIHDYAQPITGVPLARFYFTHSLYEKQRLPEARIQARLFLEDVAEAGPQRILNMPNGIIGREVSDLERAASRFRARSCSPEAQADAHTMLGIIAERLDGPSAAIPHFEKVLELGSNSKQRVECHDNLAETYSVLGNEAKRDEHRAAALKMREQVAEEDEKAKQKLAEEEAHNVAEGQKLAAEEAERDAAGKAGASRQDDEPAIPELA